MSQIAELEAIFTAALEKAGGERASYLESACCGDGSLRRRVEKMLAAQADIGNFLESPPSAIALAIESSETSGNSAAIAEGPGSRIRSYKLLEQIGEGGFGVVYMAEQLEPVRRRVALKIIKPGMDTKEVIARFESERQALALMDHPNIAKVLDAGATDRGGPYFVMELVNGVQITDYCEASGVSVEDRLQLFVQVCQAVQHAHQKGIIHRDLKPSNVMVTLHDGRPVPKLLDFGVAKATSQQFTERTLFTAYGAMIGTPAYMSPEQAELSGLDIDTRSDVYSLGVLLYELLTGTTPFDSKSLRAAGFDEMRRIIREEEPETVSARVARTRTELRIADFGLRITGTQNPQSAIRTPKLHELDWIVSRALEKDRNRRYESASGFAADIQRYLADEPVQACPPSAAYRLRKFARRHQAPLAMATVLALALLLAVSVIGWAIRDRAARKDESARARADRQTRVSDQIHGILEEVARLEEEQKWPEALETAQAASALVAGSDADAADAKHVREAIDNLKFVQLLDDIRASRSEFSEDTRFDFRATADRYVAAFRDAGLDLGRVSVEEAAQWLRARSGETAAIVPALDDWAVCLQASGDTREAERVWELAGLVDPDDWRQKVRTALRSKDDVALQTLAESPDITHQPASTLTSLEVALRERGHLAAALAVLTLAQRQHPADFWVHFGMGQVMEKQSPPSLDQAAGCYRAALAVRPRSAAAWNNLGNMLKKLNKLDDATVCYERAIELNPKLFFVHANLGLARYKQGQRDKAIVNWRKAIELNPSGPLNHSNLGHALLDQGKVDEAIVHFHKAVELQPRFSVAHFNLGAALAKQQKLDEAIASYRRAIEIDPDFVLAHQRLAAVLFTKMDFASAVEIIQKVISLQPQQPGPRQNLGVALNFLGRQEEAMASHRKALELKPDYPEACISLSRLLTTCADLDLRNADEALQLARLGVKLAPQSSDAWAALGGAQFRSGDAMASIESLEKSIALQIASSSSRIWQLLFLAMAHWQLGAKVEAQEHYARAIAQMNKSTMVDDDLRRIRAEAEVLLEIKVTKDE